MVRLHQHPPVHINKWYYFEQSEQGSTIVPCLIICNFMSEIFEYLVAVITGQCKPNQAEKTEDGDDRLYEEYKEQQ